MANTLNFEIKYCPSCSSEKLENDKYCGVCGFDFSFIKGPKSTDRLFIYFLQIIDKSVFKFRNMKLLDSDSNLILDFRSKYVFIGSKFEILDAQSKFISFLKTAASSRRLSILSSLNEPAYYFGYDHTLHTIIITDLSGKILFDYSCYAIFSGSFELHDKNSDHIIQFIKVNNENPRNIKIITNFEVKDQFTQIFVVTFYFMLFHEENFLPLLYDENVQKRNSV